jgi:hypothetical protein
MDPRGNGKRTHHAVDLLMVVIKCILAKNLTGWEVMEVFAGGVNTSDKVFTVMCFPGPGPGKYVDSILAGAHLNNR